MTVSQRLNSLIASEDYKTYLQIGVRPQLMVYKPVSLEALQSVTYNTLTVFDNIDVSWKLAITPSSRPEYGRNSNLYCLQYYEFFNIVNQINPDARFDLIFVDKPSGLSEAYHLLTQALEYLSPTGTLVMHNVAPHYSYQEKDIVQRTYTGMNWRALLQFRQLYPEYHVFTELEGAGLAFIKKQPLADDEVVENVHIEQWRPETAPFSLIQDHYKKILNVTDE